MKPLRNVLCVLFLLPFVLVLVCVACLAHWCGLLREVD